MSISLSFGHARAQDDLHAQEEECQELTIRADKGEELQGKELLLYRECRAKREAALGVANIGAVVEGTSASGIVIAIILLILLL